MPRSNRCTRTHPPGGTDPAAPDRGGLHDSLEIRLPADLRTGKYNVRMAVVNEDDMAFGVKENVRVHARRPPTPTKRAAAFKRAWGID